MSSELSNNRGGHRDTSADAGGQDLQEEYDAALAKCSAAEVSAHNVGAEIDLVAPPEICKLEAEAHDKATTCEPRTENEFILVRARLRIAMRYDLQDLDIPEDNELSKLAEVELGNQGVAQLGEAYLGTLA